MDKKIIIAIAAAVIAEEEKCGICQLRIVSFRSVTKNSLEQYIAEHGIQYKKYQLGD